MAKSPVFVVAVVVVSLLLICSHCMDFTLVT